MVDIGLNTCLEGMPASVLFVVLKIIHEYQFRTFVHCNFENSINCFELLCCCVGGMHWTKR
jgi:hypothetical protein